MINKKEVRAVARLARLDLNEKEVKKYTDQLEKVLELFEKIKTIELEDIRETSQVSGLVNVCQEDKPSYDQRTRPKGKKENFLNVPQKNAGGIVVPRVIEQ